MRKGSPPGEGLKDMMWNMHRWGLGSGVGRNGMGHEGKQKTWHVCRKQEMSPGA